VPINSRHLQTVHQDVENGFKVFPTAIDVQIRFDVFVEDERLGGGGNAILMMIAMGWEPFV
jgi:hypothetical protein